jgi:surface polysaccharide O-acyltransferase-like enzyme
MDNKIGWIDNLRAVACMMVVMIHATTYPVTQGVVGEHNWDVANLLNSLSRVSVPLFFMISGYLFFGERSANRKHFTRIACCILFYSIIALIYIGLFTTHISFWPSLRNILQTPVFYHLWFFYAIVVIYLLSPLISVKPVSGRYLAGVLVILAVIANPNTNKLNYDNIHLLPVDLYIYGDTFYYLLYALAGRAIGTMETQKRGMSWLAALGFVGSVLLIMYGTKHQSLINENFASTYYMYSGPLVFIAAVSLLVWCKNCLSQPIGWLSIFSRHSLAIYGFHAIIVNVMRKWCLEISPYPLLDIFWVFGVALILSLLLSIGLQKIDKRRLVS